MKISDALLERAQHTCELCTAPSPSISYVLSPKSDDKLEHLVALCTVCHENLEKEGTEFHWRCLEGSIWNPEPVVQALSFRLLQRFKDKDWAAAAIGAVELDEAIEAWALSALEIQEVHKDAFGNLLASGDNVVLTQALDVKGTNFTASKGTVVKRIKLVHDNTDQIEGKINEQTIVILTKYVKKL